MTLHSDREGNDCIRKSRCHCIQIMHSDINSVVGVIITLGFLGENEFILLGFLPLFLSSVDDLRFCWTEDKNTTIFWIWLLLAEFRILVIYSLATSFVSSALASASGAASGAASSVTSSWVITSSSTIGGMMIFD